MKDFGKKSIPVLVLLSYVLMVTVNALANILPINGISTGDVSDSYVNLFAPAAITFSIWGVIYLLLLIYSVYQLKYYAGVRKELLLKLGKWFALSSLFNTMWIFMWHYDFILISLLLMLGILICLIMINQEIKDFRFETKEKLFVRLPFGVYFGWITVATIANFVTFLISVNWSMFGINEVIWASLIIIIGSVIGSISTIYFKCGAYAVVIVWAYAGIIIKHINTFNSEYPAIMVSTIIGIILVCTSVVYLLKTNRNI